MGKESLCWLVVEIPLICAPMYCAQVPSNILSAFGDRKFANNYSEGRQMSVDILIGLDFYWKFVKGGIVYLTEGLVAQETFFGWVISGS